MGGEKNYPSPLQKNKTKNKYYHNGCISILKDRLVPLWLGFKQRQKDVVRVKPPAEKRNSHHHPPKKIGKKKSKSLCFLKGLE